MKRKIINASILALLFIITIAAIFLLYLFNSNVNGATDSTKTQVIIIPTSTQIWVEPTKVIEDVFLINGKEGSVKITLRGKDPIRVYFYTQSGTSVFYFIRKENISLWISAFTNRQRDSIFAIEYDGTHTDVSYDGKDTFNLLSYDLNNKFFTFETKLSKSAGEEFINILKNTISVII